METRKLETGLFFLAVAVFCVAYALGQAERIEKQNGENLGECVVMCLEFNADTPEELNDPKLNERCKIICENGLTYWAEFDTTLEYVKEYGEI